MRALLDGDILLYRIGYANENESEEIALFKLNEYINNILTRVEADEYNIYLSAGRTDTFRAKLNPDYKANRVQPKPLHYDILKKCLIEDWKAEVAVEQEADDLLGINQTEDTVICSIDKDLLQIPGNHYDFVKDIFSYVTKEQGLLFFYKQLIIGDTVDNVKGVWRVGKAGAEKILAHLEGQPEEELFKAIQDCYRTWLKTEWCLDAHDGWDRFKEHQMNNIITLNGQMLKIRQKDNEIWNPPMELILNQETELQSGLNEQMDLGLTQ